MTTLTDTITVAGTRHPRFPLAGASSLNERLRMGREREHFRASINRGPVCIFAVMVRAAHKVLKGLGWHVVETGIPERGGHP